VQKTRFHGKQNTLLHHQYPGHLVATARLTHHSATEEFLEAVFSMQSMARLYKEDKSQVDS
jgi:hypothetical protein